MPLVCTYLYPLQKHEDTPSSLLLSWGLSNSNQNEAWSCPYLPSICRDASSWFSGSKKSLAMISIMVHGEPRSLLLSNWSSPPLPLFAPFCPLTNGAKTQLGLECSLLSPSPPSCPLSLSSILLLPAPDRHLSRAREMRSGRGERGELVTERD